MFGFSIWSFVSEKDCFAGGDKTVFCGTAKRDCGAEVRLFQVVCCGGESPLPIHAGALGGSNRPSSMPCCGALLDKACRIGTTFGFDGSSCLHAGTSIDIFAVRGGTIRSTSFLSNSRNIGDWTTGALDDSVSIGDSLGVPRGGAQDGISSSTVELLRCGSGVV